MSDPIRALVVDDEPLARERIRGLLAKEDDVELVGECADGPSAIEAIERDGPDLVFLDVQMPELDGFDVLEAVEPEKLPCVIFVTAYDEYAVRAFEVHALDYVLKPFENTRLLAALERARERRRSRQDGELARGLAALLGGRSMGDRRPDPHTDPQFVERFTVRQDDRIQFVSAEEVDWIEAEGNYAVLHAGAAAHRIRLTLQAIERQLDPRRFARIHRSTIVNLARVREIQPWFGGDYIAILQGGRKLRVSRTRAGPLLQPMR
jgi:two-component system LytT family response regulator